MSGFTVTPPRIPKPRPGSFTELLYKLGHAIAKAQAVPDSEEEKAARAVKRCDDLGRRLLLRPARNIDDMLTKIMVAGYFSDEVTPKRQGDRVGFGFQPNWEPGPDAPLEILVLSSLRADIQRLKRGRIAP
jgi:hypothetical protein